MKRTHSLPSGLLQMASLLIGLGILLPARAGMIPAVRPDAVVQVNDLPLANARVHHDGRWLGGGPWAMDLFPDTTATTPLWKDILVYCIELNESLRLGRRYGLENIAPWAQQGGEGGRQSDPDPSDSDDAYPRDPISAASAWLYLETALPGGRYHADPSLWDDVQLALWVLEDELTLSEVPDSAQTLVATALTEAGHGDDAGDRVVGYNLVDRSGRHAQTMLGLLPTLAGPVPAPEPALWLLTGVGLLGLLRHRRARTRSTRPARPRMA